jgi:hypothetical protein
VICYWRVGGVITVGCIRSEFHSTPRARSPYNRKIFFQLLENQMKLSLDLHLELTA